MTEKFVEATIRTVARIVVEECGYKVLEARNGLQGLDRCKSHEGPIDLLVPDVVMPELDGRVRLNPDGWRIR